jgi:putative endonuclease
MRNDVMENNYNCYYVYILSNKKHGTLYVGSTNNLQRRIYQHKNGLIKDSFTDKYKLHNLVYYEGPTDIEAARHREWIVKRWKRQWKYNIIEKNNPDWVDLPLSL